LPPAIPPLGDISTEPDRDTKKGLKHDFTSPSAENRVLHINLGFFKYGTDDKAHAGAMVLSMVLLVMIFLTGLGGFIAGVGDWTKTLLQMLGSAFTFVAGVAIGQGLSKKAKGEDDGDE
jgi:hypothetical protein